MDARDQGIDFPKHQCWRGNNLFGMRQLKKKICKFSLVSSLSSLGCMFKFMLYIILIMCLVTKAASIHNTFVANSLFGFHRIRFLSLGFVSFIVTFTIDYMTLDFPDHLLEGCSGVSSLGTLWTYFPGFSDSSIPLTSSSY